MTREMTIKAINHTRLEEAPYYEIYNTNNELIAEGHNWGNAVIKEITEILDENKTYEVDFCDRYCKRYYTEYGKIVVKEI